MEKMKIEANATDKLGDEVNLLKKSMVINVNEVYNTPLMNF